MVEIGGLKVCAPYQLMFEHVNLCGDVAFFGRKVVDQVYTMYIYRERERV